MDLTKIYYISRNRSSARRHSRVHFETRWSSRNKPGRSVYESWRQWWYQDNDKNALEPLE